MFPWSIVFQLRGWARGIEDLLPRQFGGDNALKKLRDASNRDRAAGRISVLASLTSAFDWTKEDNEPPYNGLTGNRQRSEDKPVCGEERNKICENGGCWNAGSLSRYLGVLVEHGW